jgi:carboxylesterase type B
VDRRDVIEADTYGPQCNQISFGQMPGLEKEMGAGDYEASEDCLFLNVQSPVNATNLPVLVWIHGGGYGAGSGQQDFTDMLNVNGNSFVAVSVQYRLGPFGFLASSEVAQRGVVNAGLLDQHFALRWVQTHIERFGGNASMVTISGESAGGGSVMLQGMAYGGSLGDSLFRSSIAASPYLPKQYAYNDEVPTRFYYAFAERAGCDISAPRLFDCLLSKDTAILQKSSAALTANTAYGTWAFLPVTDGKFIQEEPSSQLLKRRLNGHNLLVGNNASTYLVLPLSS